MVDEEKLLIRLRKRQKNSIDRAIEIYTPYLSTVLYNMVGNTLPKEDIEEIVSDVFVALWKNAEYIDTSKGTVRSYIAATARNFALKKLNKKRDYASLDDIEISDERNYEEAYSDADEVDGIDVYYFRYTNKNVPPNYEMTEEDKRAEENGDLVFSYGSDKVYLSEVQSVSFKKDDIYFNLMQIDGKLSEYELSDMAKEIISSK